MKRPKSDDEDCIIKLLIFCQASRAGCAQQPPQKLWCDYAKPKAQSQARFFEICVFVAVPLASGKILRAGTTQKANFRLPEASIFTIFTVEPGFDCWLSKYFKKIYSHF